jgi:membrane-anchored mycosin MYCP
MTRVVPVRAVAVLLLSAGLTLSGGPMAHAARPPADPCGQAGAAPGAMIENVSWAQQWMDPDQLAPLATGAGQVVAVIDTGVDGTHQQLRGRLTPGADFIRRTTHDVVDCAGHGTAIASLIAAQPIPKSGLRGVAPAARIMPIRVTDADPSSEGRDSRAPSPLVVAEAIDWAARHGATVIQVSPSFAVDPPQLRAAVARALGAGIPVVAAAGDRHDDSRAVDGPTFPASYPGVIGVGAVDRLFTRMPSSMAGPQVMVVGPGDGVVAAARIGGQQVSAGSSVAAGFVAATVALLRQTRPDLTPQRIAARIMATADPAAGGRSAPGYGAGLVNPYRALTEPLSPARPQPVSGAPLPRVDQAGRAQQLWWQRMASIATLGALAAAGLVLLLVVAVAALRRGRPGGWRPTRLPAAPPPPDDPVDDGDLFALPSATNTSPH